MIDLDPRFRGDDDTENAPLSVIPAKAGIQREGSAAFFNGLLRLQYMDHTIIRGNQNLQRRVSSHVRCNGCTDIGL